MTEETNTQTVTTEAPVVEVVAPDTKKPAEVKAEPAKQPEAKAAPEGKKEPKAASDSKRTRLAGDDEIPDDADLLEMSPTALKQRLNRATKKELKAQFGTDDIDQIKKDLAEVKSLREEKEKARREKLDKEARMSEDLKKAKADARAAKAEARSVKMERVIDEEERSIVALAEKHLKPKYVKYVLPELRKFLLSEYSPKELEDISGAKREKLLDKFFADFAEKEDPSWAKDHDPAKAAAEAKEAKPKINSGADARNRPSPASSNDTAKTFAPGKANSMTRGEARAEARRLGYSWT
jgi:hypothetical protein